MVSSGCRMRSLWFIIVISFLPNTEGKIQFTFCFLNPEELELYNLLYMEVPRIFIYYFKNSH